MESVQYETNVDIFKAPRNTRRVVAASAVAVAVTVAADQLQAATAATRHVREGVDESACEGCGGAKCKLQQISMFMAHVVRNFHTFDFLKDAQRVPPTQPYPTLALPPSPCCVARRVLCPSSGIAGSRSHSLALETQLPFLCHSSN